MHGGLDHKAMSDVKLLYAVIINLINVTVTITVSHEKLQEASWISRRAPALRLLVNAM